MDEDTPRGRKKWTLGSLLVLGAVVTFAAVRRRKPA